MSALTITLDKSVIYNEVNKITAYTGAKSSDEGSDFDRMASNSYNSEILDRYFDEAVGSINDLLRPYSPAVVSEGISCDMPSNWDYVLAPVLCDTAKTFVIDHIVSKWMRLVKAENEKMYAEDRDNAFEALRRFVHYRKAPSRN